MRRSPALPVVALLATALLGLAGCGGAAKQPRPALSNASATAEHSAHDHGASAAASAASPPVAPHGGVLDLRIDQLGPQDVVFQWKPGNLLVKAGQKVTLEIANHDYMQHNLTFKAAKVNQNLVVGKTTTVSFTAPPAGTYSFWCKYHLQMMQGKVTVQG